jgi:hypothetical protein
MENHIIISFDSTNKNDNIIMTVGRIRRDHHIDVVNIFQGDEARELYEKLIANKSSLYMKE